MIRGDNVRFHELPRRDVIVSVLESETIDYECSIYSFGVCLRSCHGIRRGFRIHEILEVLHGIIPGSWIPRKKAGAIVNEPPPPSLLLPLGYKGDISKLHKGNITI